jgi:hypothetical protein
VTIRRPGRRQDFAGGRAGRRRRQRRQRREPTSLAGSGRGRRRARQCRAGPSVVRRRLAGGSDHQGVRVRIGLRSHRHQDGVAEQGRSGSQVVAEVLGRAAAGSTQSADEAVGTVARPGCRHGTMKTFLIVSHESPCT